MSRVDSVPEVAWDTVQVSIGGGLWAYGASVGDPLAVNVGFLNVAAVIGTRMGWV